MAEAKQGDQVRVHYTGKLKDGTVFDTSVDKEPLEFKIGEAQLIAGFQDAVVGMDPGEDKSFTLASEDAYGPYHEQLAQKVERAHLPADIELELGMRLSATDGQGNSIPVTVTELDETNVTLDANHPLAGEDLTFEITLVEIL